MVFGPRLEGSLVYGLSGPPAMTPPELRERLVLQGQMAIKGRKSHEEQLLAKLGIGDGYTF